MSSSCSFRITRTAEDLAQTITALSHRLVKLEQRQESLELQLTKKEEEPPAEEIAILDGVEDLLRECQDLLDLPSPTQDNVESFSAEQEESLAA